MPSTNENWIEYGETPMTQREAMYHKDWGYSDDRKPPCKHMKALRSFMLRNRLAIYADMEYKLEVYLCCDICNKEASVLLCEVHEEEEDDTQW